MVSILILHSDLNIGSAIGNMIEGIEVEKKLPRHKIKVHKDFDFGVIPESEQPEFIFIEEKFLISQTTDLQCCYENSSIILISRSGKISRSVLRKSHWKYDDVLSSPIERDELSKILVSTIESK